MIEVKYLGIIIGNAAEMYQTPKNITFVEFVPIPELDDLLSQGTLMVNPWDGQMTTNNGSVEPILVNLIVAIKAASLKYGVESDEIDEALEKRRDWFME